MEIREYINYNADEIYFSALLCYTTVDARTFLKELWLWEEINGKEVQVI